MGTNLVKFIQDTMQEGKIPIKCGNCGYKWEYSGDMARATCPSCSRKSKVDEQRLDK